MAPRSVCSTYAETPFPFSGLVRNSFSHSKTAWARLPALAAFELPANP